MAGDTARPVTGSDEAVATDADEVVHGLERAVEANDRFRPVHIAGDVVTRPASSSTPAVHAYLRHLRRAGLDCVPTPLGVDGGVERLSYVDGESGGDGWFHQHTDDGVASAARLLRTVHDAGRGFRAPPEATWTSPPVSGSDLVWCHGDPGPWNFVWRDGQAVGLIDWDYLHLAPRLDDVAYALQWFAPTRSDELTLSWHHFPAVPDRRHRIAVFLGAYGDVPEFDVVDAVTARMQATSDLMQSLAERGQEPQRTWVQDGALEREATEIAWVRDHRDILT
jgi:hypothetical protein